MKQTDSHIEVDFINEGSTVGELHPEKSWPREDSSRVPLWVYTDHENYRRELERVFYGPHWHMVGLESEIPNPGDFVRAVIGERSVIVTKTENEEISVLLNSCAHRGVEISQAAHGTQKEIMCPYHQWTYDLKGNLIGVPFKRGVKGKGGFPEDFDTKNHGLRRLKVENVNGCIFATFDHDAPNMREYLGKGNYEYFTRIFNGRKTKVLGHQRQRIKGNWKLYMENIKDPYHASLLHVFLISFGLYRIDQQGVTVTDERTLAHNVFASIRNPAGDTSGTEDMKSYRKDLKLNDMSLVTAAKEFEDEVSIQIQTVFPDLVLQQQGNSLQLRYVIPLGPDEFELQWTYFGYEDDSEEMTLRRLRQANLTGPSGYVSVDDTEVLEYSGAGIRPNPSKVAILELGGRGGEAPDDGNMVTEGPIRGFYEYYRRVMYGDS
ncbi:MAG: salicylate hydroxylase [Pusillimonas sp.]|jgi:phenylpropionate dioxygenase-like ring-hydroxylating dioxygenase large terminal subunit|nr:salicylate hydroxylase [Pusillimonas sp.]